jgi:GNAT superfamily N-acetyltransferase
MASVMQVDPALIDARMGRGCRCFTARVGDEIVAYGWLATRTEWIGELELEITPGQGEAYIWNCATDPQHRRQGFFRAVVGGIALQAKQEGRERVWIGTLDIPPAKAVPQLGFQPAIRFTSVWFSGVRWLHVMPVPDADEALVSSACEVLAIAGRPLRLGSSMKRAESRVH